MPSITYPSEGAFVSSVAALIDEERRQLYELEGRHYENIQFLTFVWKFPLPIVKTTSHWFVEGIDKQQDGQSLTKLLQVFTDTVERCVGLVSLQLFLEKLNTEDLLSFLNVCISGETLPVAKPPPETSLNVVLGRHTVMGGYIPRVGSKNVVILSIIGYMNSETIPGILEEMSFYPLMYRWANRFIPYIFLFVLIGCMSAAI